MVTSISRATCQRWLARSLEGRRRPQSDCELEDSAREENELIAEQGVGGDAGGDIRRERRNARINATITWMALSGSPESARSSGESIRMLETFPAIAPRT